MKKQEWSRKNSLQSDMILGCDQSSENLIRIFGCKRKSHLLSSIVETVGTYLIAFPTSYLVEKGFSAVGFLLSKHRNGINICERGDL